MRKNILILAHNYGMQFLESCNQYTRLYDKSLYEVTVVFLTGESDADMRVKTLAENVIFMNCHKSEIRGLKISAIKKLLSLCREKKFTTVICHRYKPTYIILWIAQFYQFEKCFFVMHALGTMSSLPRKLFMAALFRKNMILAGVSDAVRDDMRKDLWRVPKKQIITLYNIIDQDLFEPQLVERDIAREQLAIPEEAFVFGNIGRLVEAKDQKTLIQALALIKPMCPKACVVIIGDGRLEVSLKELTRELQLEDAVIFAGFIPDSFQLIKAFDTLVLCSIEEAFGRVLLEAMIARLPVIASEVDGIPEVVGDSGYLVTADNAPKLANIMQEIYHLPQNDLLKQGENGYQRMLKMFSLAPFEKDFWHAYNSL
jgi:glycosyltransferase involved in cell wall biosynthesis